MGSQFIDKNAPGTINTSPVIEILPGHRYSTRLIQAYSVIHQGGTNRTFLQAYEYALTIGFQIEKVYTSLGPPSRNA